MTSTYKFTLDLHEMISPIIVRVKEGESSRALEITLCEDGKPVEINGRTNSAALAVSVGSSGYYGACEITSNKIKRTLPTDITSTVGRHPAEVKIFKMNGADIAELLYTATFYVEVYPKVDAAGFDNVGEDTFDALTELLGQTTAFLNNELITDISYDATGDVMTISLVDGHGTAADPIVISGLKGAKGDKGDKGDTGDTGAAGADGADGADGVGIVSIEKTGTAENLDIYTIYLSDSSSYTFTVTNGSGGGTTVPVYTLEWVTSEMSPADQETKTAANVTIFNTINGASPNTYRLVLKKGDSYCQAISVVGKSAAFVEPRNDDTLIIYTLKAQGNNCVQSSVGFPEIADFDDMSDAPASMALIAEYVADYVSDHGGIAYTGGTGVSISGNTISLSSAAQTSLGKADTALQEIPTYILQWNDDDATVKASNMNILESIDDGVDSQFRLLLKISGAYPVQGTYLPCFHEYRYPNGVGCAVYFCSVDTSRGQFTVYSMTLSPFGSTYSKISHTYPETTFDAQSTAAPASSAVAAYIATQISGKQDKSTEINGSSATVTIAELADNTEYRYTDLETLTISAYPSGNFEAWLKLTFAASGTITVTLPTSSYIGATPTFGNGETWEISIKDGVVVAGKVS